jgi:hypothetical protein
MADDPKAEYEARKKAQADATAKYWTDAAAMTPTPTQEENDLAAMGLLPNGPAAAPETPPKASPSAPRPTSSATPPAQH